MAQRIRVPGIVDILRVSDPAEIRTANEIPAVDRRFVSRGPLINRLVVGRIRRWFQIGGQPLPSLAPRDDVVRAERQRKLAAALDPAARPLWTSAQIAELAGFVRGAKGAKDAGKAAVTLQQIVGALFYPDYTADDGTWKAASLIDRFRDGFSPVQILWEITGRLRRARNLLVERARNDRWAMHGSAIGVHGIVHALERMRDLRKEAGADSLPDDAMLARCLHPPRQVPRVADGMLPTTLTKQSLRPGTLVLFQLEAAGARTSGAEMVFMQGHWNACPAQLFVVELLKAVWRASLK